MHFLLYFTIVVHVIVCFFLIGVVLLQQGKSADLAGTFGGQGSQTAFGPRAAANLLTKMTSYAAGLFMITSLSLTILYIRSTGSGTSVFSGMKGAATPAPVSAPAKPGAPAKK
jgi:preprotein translocase subunit SecG